MDERRTRRGEDAEFGTRVRDVCDAMRTSEVSGDGLTPSMTNGGRTVDLNSNARGNGNENKTTHRDLARVRRRFARVNTHGKTRDEEFRSAGERGHAIDATRDVDDSSRAMTQILKRQRATESPYANAFAENGVGATTRRRASMTMVITEPAVSPGFNMRKKRRQSVGRRVSFADPATLESVREFIKVRASERRERAGLIMTDGMTDIVDAFLTFIGGRTTRESWGVVQR